MLRLVMLGTGSATPTPYSFPSCFALKTGSTFLFDCCEGCQQRMMKYKISYAKVNCIFITHLHSDHFLGIFGLLQTMGLHGRTEELTIAGPEGTENFLSSVLSLKPLQPKFPIKFVEAKGKKKVYEDKLIIVESFAVKHNCKALGYVIREAPIRKFNEAKAKGMGMRGRLFTLIQEKGFVEVAGKKIMLDEVSYLKEGKKIVYTGDTVKCAAVEKAAEGADLLIHDSTFSEGEKEMAKEKWHTTATEAAGIAKKANVKKLLLTHFSSRYVDVSKLEEEARKIFANTEAAKPGMELLI